MTDDAGDAVLAAKAVEDRHRLTHPHRQRQAQGAQVGAQPVKAFGDEGPVPGRGVGAGPERRLDDVDRQDRPQPRRKGQRRVVLQAEIALQPDENIHGT